MKHEKGNFQLCEQDCKPGTLFKRNEIDVYRKTGSYTETNEAEVYCQEIRISVNGQERGNKE
jgi:hypothetical protein